MVLVRLLMMMVPLLLLGEIRVPVQVSATFVQTVTPPNKKIVRYTGELLLNRSHEFRWRYTSPTRREICGDGDRVRVIDHRLQQVVIYKVGSLLDPMQVLKRAKPYRGDLYLARYHGTRYTLKVDPKGQLEQIAYTDGMDNVVNIHFHEVHYGETPFPPEQLQCDVPPSYDRIKG